MKGKYVSETILKMLLLLFAVTILSFILITKAPIDPLTSYIGSESTLSPAARQQIADYWGLNQPLVQSYFTWLGNIFRGDFGMSITYKRPVIDVIGERFSASLVLMLLAWLCSGVLGFFLGMASGKHKGSVFDKITQGFCLVLQSTPTFWIWNSSPSHWVGSRSVCPCQWASWRPRSHWETACIISSCHFSR